MKTILLNANIGAGKSTLLSNLKKKLGDSITILQEPVWKFQCLEDHSDPDVKWNPLEEVYTSQDVFTFQTLVMASIATEFQRTYSEAIKNGSKYFIMERDMDTAVNIFARASLGGNLTSYKFSLLNTIRDSYHALIPEITRVDVSVYLQVPAKVCYDRMMKRNRYEESIVPLEFLEQLHSLHENTYSNSVKVDGCLDATAVVKNFLDII